MQVTHLKMTRVRHDLGVKLNYLFGLSLSLLLLGSVCASQKKRGKTKIPETFLQAKKGEGKPKFLKHFFFISTKILETYMI